MRLHRSLVEHLYFGEGRTPPNCRHEHRGDEKPWDAGMNIENVGPPAQVSGLGGKTAQGEALVTCVVTSTIISQVPGRQSDTKAAPKVELLVTTSFLLLLVRHLLLLAWHLLLLTYFVTMPKLLLVFTVLGPFQRSGRPRPVPLRPSQAQEAVWACAPRAAQREKPDGLGESGELASELIGLLTLSQKNPSDKCRLPDWLTE